VTEKEFYSEVLKDENARGYMTDYLVLIKLRHMQNEPWRYTRELYIVDMERNGKYHSWENDWWEGEEFVHILDFVALEDVIFPHGFKEGD